jgi:hypothetical protein
MLEVLITNNSKTAIVLKFQETKQIFTLQPNESRTVKTTKKELDTIRKSLATAFMSKLVTIDILCCDDQQTTSTTSTVETQTTNTSTSTKKKLYIEDIKEE